MSSNIGNVAAFQPYSYIGTQPPLCYTSHPFPPLPGNTRFTVPTLWLDSVSKTAYLLTSKAGGVAVWDVLQSSADLNSITTPDAQVVVPIANNINFVEAGGISITGDPSTGSVIFEVNALGIGWAEVTQSTKAMIQDEGYVASRTGTQPTDQTVFSLPTTAAQFTNIIVVGNGTAGWRIAQGAGQQIKMGPSSTTLGAGGYLQATGTGDFVQLFCVTADTTWRVIGSQGNITVV